MEHGPDSDAGLLQGRRTSHGLWLLFTCCLSLYVVVLVVVAVVIVA